jgi:hypothetical protein
MVSLKNEQTAKIMDNGFHFFWEIPIEKSRTGNCFKSVPNNRFFLETDTVKKIYAKYMLWQQNIRQIWRKYKTNK